MDKFEKFEKREIEEIRIRKKDVNFGNVLLKGRVEGSNLI